MRIYPWIKASLFLGGLLGIIALLLYGHDKLRPHPSGGDFTLKGEHHPVSLKDSRGQLRIIVFGYTSCPDVCPRELGRWDRAYRNMTPEEQERVQIIFISVDSERDSPKRAANYANNFNSEFVGLSGSAKRVKEVTEAYGVNYEKVNKEGEKRYMIDHTSYSYIINPRGELVEMLPANMTIESRLERARHWVHEGKK